MAAPIHRGDLYWIAPEHLKGPPSIAPHPYVVVSDDVFNHSRLDTVVVCALTTNLHKAQEPGNVLLEPGEGDLPKRSAVVVSQIATVAKRHLTARIGALEPSRVDQILAGLRFQQRSFGRR